MFDVFCKIDGIPGESTDSAHPDEIEVLAFTHELDQPGGGPVSSSGGASAERCNHGAFKIKKYLDLASPKLALYCSNGTHIPEVVVSLNRAGGDKVEYMNYKMTNVMIGGVELEGDANGEDALPAEWIEFEYAKIEWTYTQQQRADGSGGGVVAAHWNLEDNTGG